MKYDELGSRAKSRAIYNEIKFQILTETRPEAIAFNGTIDKLYTENKAFFEDCCRQDEFNITGTIIKPPQHENLHYRNAEQIKFIDK